MVNQYLDDLPYSCVELQASATVVNLGVIERVPLSACVIRSTWQEGLHYSIQFFSSANGQCSKDIVLTDQFHGEALVNHTYQTLSVVDHDGCQLYCFLDNRCISYNFDDQRGVCNLSDSDHVMHSDDLVDISPDVIYYRVKVIYSKQKRLFWWWWWWWWS